MTGERGADSPDFEQQDLPYDVWMPFLAGATEPVLRGVGDLPRGASVLDLAAGTGEPALTLAVRRPDLAILGVDSSERQVEAARAAADAAGVATVRFEQMDMAALDLPDASVDAVTSRLGALLFGDPEPTAQELTRVLRPGAPFSMSVWGPFAEHPGMEAVQRAFATTGQAGPDVSRFEAMAREGVRDGWLRAAGVAEVRTERIGWTADCPDLEAWFELVRTGAQMVPGAYASLDDDDLDVFRAEVARVAQPWRTADGGYALEGGARLVTGRR